MTAASGEADLIFSTLFISLSLMSSVRVSLIHGRVQGESH